jgi:diguanylate cyclase (GGDEF)-like protein
MSKAIQDPYRLLLVNASDVLREAAARALPTGTVLLECADFSALATVVAREAPDVVLVALAEAGSEARAALVEARQADGFQADWLCAQPRDGLSPTAASELADWTLLELVDPDSTMALADRFDDASLARVVARVMHQRQVAEENRQLRSRIETMEICKDLVYCLEPGKLYARTLDLLLHMTSRGRGFAIFRRESSQQSGSIALRGFSEGETPAICHSLLEEKPIDLEAFDGVQVIHAGAIHDALRYAGSDVDSLLVLPMSGTSGEAGVVCVLDQGRPFTPDELTRSVVVAENGVAALHNAEIYSLAKERAFIDDVTEVYNARYLLSTCENEIQRAERYNTPLSVLFLDLDRFKLVNDEYGHLVGSETLRRLSRVLLNCVRQVDTVARYGGDEFTILLIDTEHAAALTIAERIRRTVADYRFETGRDNGLGLTISIGVASYPEHGGDRDALLDFSDKAMYRAKSDGRNLVVSASTLI